MDHQLDLKRKFLVYLRERMMYDNELNSDASTQRQKEKFIDAFLKISGNFD